MTAFIHNTDYCYPGAPFSFIYVVSTSYAGSTLLSMIMNAHPEITSIGELSNSIGTLMTNHSISQYYCSCGEKIEDCSFWRKVTDKCREKGIDLDLHAFGTNLKIGRSDRINRLLFSLPWNFHHAGMARNDLLWRVPFFRGALNSLIGRNLTIARSILDTSHKKIFFDASKDVTLAFHYMKAMHSGMKLVHLVRDPRAVLYSCIKRNSNRNQTKYARYWVKVNRSALQLKTRLGPSKYLLVKYESLCEEPDSTLSDICRFAGVDSLDLPHLVDRQTHHLVGNTMRLKKFSGVKLSEEWKRNLSAAQLKECMEITAGMRTVLQYQ